MQHLEVNGVPVLYIGRTVPKGFNLFARCGWLVSATLHPLYPRERDSVIIVQEAECVLGSVWTYGENRPRPGFDSRIVQAVASRYTD